MVHRPSLSIALRRAVVGLALDGFYTALLNAGRFHPRARARMKGVTCLRGIRYLDSALPEHTLDVYLPAARARREPGRVPIVMYVHGGGFRVLSKDTHFMMGAAFARRGYVVFNVNYRLAPRHPFPAAAQDVAAALGWVWRNGERFGGNRDRLALAGESAGANLVTTLALATSYARPEPWARALFEAGVRPRAVVAACGLLQVTDVERFRRQVPDLKWLTEDRAFEVRKAYLGDEYMHNTLIDLADPLCMFERAEPPDRELPAFFAPCGTADALMDDTERLERALSRLGASCDARYYADQGHAFHLLGRNEQARRCWIDTFRFLRRHLDHDANSSSRSAMARALIAPL